MNVKTKTNIMAITEVRDPVHATCQRVEIARLPDRAGEGDRRTDQGRRRRIHCGVIPAAIRQERSASAGGSLFVDHVLLTAGRICQSITDLEAAEPERYATSRTGVGSKPGYTDSVEERTGLHLPVWKGSALLSLRTTRC